MRIVLDTNVLVSGLLHSQRNPGQVLALALAGSADYLVTGNLADYPPEKRCGCAIVSPAEFMRIWNRGQPTPPQARE